MNILVVTAMFPPIQTGSSFYSQDLAGALKDRGHEITVATLVNKNLLSEDAEYPVERLTAIHLENLFKNHFKHLRISSIFPWNYWRLSDLIKKKNIDVVFLASHYHDIGFIAVAASLLNNKPLVCSVNTQLQLNNSFGRRVLNLLDRMICGHLVLPFCRKIISLDMEIERYVRDVYRRQVVDKSIVIPYGVHGVLEGYLDEEHDYGEHKQLIGVGAVIEQRDFMFSIAVFSQLLKNFPDLRFRIIGHIYHHRTLELVRGLGIEDKVLFTGELSHEEILQELRRSDLYMGIFSGEYTALGSATIEAMLTGVPVLSDAPPDLFGERLLFDMDNYVYANKNDIDQVVRKVTDLLHKRELREKVGKGGREFILEHLSWESVGEKIESLLKDVIVKRRGDK